MSKSSEEQSTFLPVSSSRLPGSLKPVLDKQATFQSPQKTPRQTNSGASRPRRFQTSPEQRPVPLRISRPLFNRLFSYDNTPCKIMSTLPRTVCHQVCSPQHGLPSSVFERVERKGLSSLPFAYSGTVASGERLLFFLCVCMLHAIGASHTKTALVCIIIFIAC